MIDSSTSESVDWPDEAGDVAPDQTELSVETPLEDAVEQARETVGRHAPVVPDQQLPIEVDPADLAEQTREVDEDEEEYR